MRLIVRILNFVFGPVSDIISKGILCFLFATTCASIPALIYAGYRDRREAAVVRTAMTDPAFVSHFKDAGYRVSEIHDGYKIRLAAQCVRADAKGPVPCDPFPAYAEPIPVDVAE